MSPPGYVFRDSGTTPPAVEEGETMRRQLTLGDQPQSSLSPQVQRLGQSPIQQKTTDSHALAMADHDIKGAAQEAGSRAEVTDVGWRSSPKDMDTLVGKLPNEQLWTLVRRFNKVSRRLSIAGIILTVQ